MNYQEQYQKLTEESNKTNEDLLKIKKEYEEKSIKLEDLSVDIKFLEDDLEDLKDDKHHMIDSKKEKISNIFGYIYTTIIALTCIAGCAIGLYFISQNISLLRPISITATIMATELIISSIVERILKKKTIRKIENSEEYKNLIIEINTKEKELVNLKELIFNLKIEFKDIEIKMNLLSDKKEETTRQLTLLKDEVFAKIMGISNAEIESKPLIKSRTK